MSVTAFIRDLIAKGFSIENALLAAEAMEANAAPVHSNRQARNRRYYEGHREELASKRRLKASETSETSEQDATPTPFLDKERTKEINPTPAPVCVSSRVREAEFDAVWAIYPHRVGKRDAVKAFTAARQRASFEAILAGVERYAAKTDDRPWCNPATFFNQDRWEDQPAHPPPPRGGGGGGMIPPRKSGKRNFIDVVRDQEREEANGHESNTGSRGNVELFPPDRSGSRRDDGFTQSGIGRRYGSGHH